MSSVADYAAMRAFGVGADEGERVTVPGGHHLLKVSPEQTRGAFVLREGFHNAGLAVDAHVHSNDESCYVLEGEYIFECEDQTLVGTAGSYIFLPRGLPHRFHVGPQGGRMLILGAPASRRPGESSLEWRPGYFEALEEALQRGPLTPEARLELLEKLGPSTAAG